jgi:hypothetical protein
MGAPVKPLPYLFAAIVPPRDDRRGTVWTTQSGCSPA